MVPKVMKNGPRQSCAKKSMVPQVVRNGPNTYANIDTNPSISTGRSVTVDIDGQFDSTYGKTRSMSMVGSIPPTENYGRSLIVDKCLEVVYGTLEILWYHNLWYHDPTVP